MPIRPKVLLIETMYHPAGEALLAEHADVQVISAATEEELKAAIAEAHAAVVRYPARLTREVIRAGRNLLVAASSGRGTDSIDIEEATEQGVAVVNNPGLGMVPVSEHTLGLILDLAKQITRDDARVRAGYGWEDRHESPRLELQGRTLDPSPDIIHKQLTIYGSWTFSTVGLEECARFIVDHHIPLGELITHRFTLDQAADAFRLFETTTTGKGAFVMA